MSETNEQQDIDELIRELNTRSLVLYNDNDNTFDWVIHNLMTICDHTIIQAEQCAQVANSKGKCKIKSGAYEDLEIIQTALSENKLTVEIQ
jgi:ATP-dependent Clp protease adaptor protein ClpS